MKSRVLTFSLFPFALFSRLWKRRPRTSWRRCRTPSTCTKSCWNTQFCMRSLWTLFWHRRWSGTGCSFVAQTATCKASISPAADAQNGMENGAANSPPSKEEAAYSYPWTLQKNNTFLVEVQIAGLKNGLKSRLLNLNLGLFWNNCNLNDMAFPSIFFLNVW